MAYSPSYSPSTPMYNPSKPNNSPIVSYLKGYNACTQDWCVTNVNVQKFSYVWTITNFSTCSKMREYLRSTEFPASGNFRWYLRLNLKDREKIYDVKVILAYGSVENTRAEVKISFLNSKGDKKNLFESLNTQYFVSGHENESYSHSFSKDDLIKNSLLSGDKLTIFVDINVIVDRIHKTSQTYIANFKEPQCKLIDDFGYMLEKERFCDVTFVVDDKKLQAHKAILAARSTVFAAMFDHEMEENNKNIVTITDINYNVLKEMLRFIYTGKSPKICELALDLLPVADKYALKKLKSMCELTLYRTLTSETAAETLTLADLHSAKQLKEQTINFIKIYAKSVENTVGWQNLIKQHPKLVSEAL